MAFKMKGSPMHKGTASHSSALKKASALKAHEAGHPDPNPAEMSEERWSGMSDKTSGTTGMSMNDIVKARDTAKAAGGNWQKYQNKINQAYGNKTVHEGGADTTKKTIGGGTKTSTTVGSETVKVKTSKDGGKVKTNTENLEGKNKTVVKDGVETKNVDKPGKGGTAKGAAKDSDTGNKDVKAAADSKAPEGGNKAADKAWKKYQKFLGRNKKREGRGQVDESGEAVKGADRAGKKATEAYEAYIAAGGDPSKV